MNWKKELKEFLWYVFYIAIFYFLIHMPFWAAIGFALVMTAINDIRQKI